MKKRNGFTLVELIVVVAILGILSGVGAVAYTGYIERANSALDETLLSDVRYALTLGVTAGSFDGEGTIGAVVLRKDAEPTVIDAAAEGADSVIVDKMLTDYFGEGYRSSLKLKSDAYSDYSTLTSVVNEPRMQSYVASMPDSVFYAGSTEDLMGEVGSVVYSFSNVLGKATGNKLNSLWGSDFTSSLNGIGPEDYSDPTTQANMTVWAAANSISGADGTAQNGWIETWSDINNDGFTVSGSDKLAPAVLYFAEMNAYAKYLDSISMYDDNRYSAKFNENLNTLSSMTDQPIIKITENLTALRTKLEENFRGDEGSWGYQNYWAVEDGKSQAQTDAEAFIGTMCALNSLQDSYVTKDGLGDMNTEKYFQSPNVTSALTYFVNACGNAELLNGLDAGYVIFVGVDANGQPVVS